MQGNVDILDVAFGILIMVGAIVCIIGVAMVWERAVYKEKHGLVGHTCECSLVLVLLVVAAHVVTGKEAVQPMLDALALAGIYMLTLGVGWFLGISKTVRRLMPPFKSSKP
jgi:hypothetical protein